jgi:NADH-quinone oxidoreductase subunit L
MTVPLVLLATFAMLLGFLGTPAWPWLQSFLDNEPASFNVAALFTPERLAMMLSSSAIVIAGLILSWWIYGRKPISDSHAHDPLAHAQPAAFAVLANAFYVDAFYRATFVRAANMLAVLSAWFDRWVWNGLVQTVSVIVLGIGYIDSFFDLQVFNTGFDESCRSVSYSARLLSRLQGGRVQLYLRAVAAACIVFVVLLLWRAMR